MNNWAGDYFSDHHVCCWTFLKQKCACKTDLHVVTLFLVSPYCSRVDYNVVRLYLLCSYSVRTAVHINYEFMMMIIEINLEANKVNDLNE